MASCQTAVATSSVNRVPDLPDTPHQPKSDFSFPKTDFGKKQVVKRLCKSAWFHKWKWLHYCEANDYVLCHVCVHAVK